MIRFAKIILSAGLNGPALILLTLSAAAATPAAMPANLPLYFEANPGQANVPAQFIARGHDYQFLISPAEAQIVLRQSGAEPAVVRLQFAGANPQALVRGDAELPGKINYLTGSNRAQWRTGVSMFARVRVGELYPGINLVYYGNQQLLEYDFTVAPGADPQAITLHFDGVDKISISPQDELILSLAGGEIRQPEPVIYQALEGVRKEIHGGYRMVDAHTVGFAVGKYDRSQPLVIDPILSYSTFFGGSAGETGYAVALDTNGNVYMTGQTLSKEISATQSFSTAGAFQTNYAGGNSTGDAFVFKLNAASGRPAYITYLGGSGNDAAYGIAVDADGNAYLTGFTDSPDFPTSPNALYGTITGTVDPNVGLYPADAFVAKLDASGSSLIYATYLGGNSSDAAYGIALDSSDNAYITGFTFSTNFPTTPNALQKQLACTNTFYINANAFVAEIASNGASLVFATYFGGNNYDTGKGIAVDSSNFVYVTGFTASTNFPTTNYVLQWIGSNLVDGHLLNNATNLNSSYDAFVAKFVPTGTNLVYSTLLGSTNNDVANGIAVDNTGAAYVTGGTLSSNFPNTFGTSIPGLTSYLATNTSSTFLVTNVFLTKITNGTNAVIAWSALFGGKGVDVGNSVAVDPAGEVFVAGSASSSDFPIFNVPTRMRYTNSGQSDAFVIAFNTNATALLYSTYLGGQNNDYGYGIAVYTNGDAYVVGQTLSANFLTYIPDYPSLNGTSDAFLAKIMLTVQPPVITQQPTSLATGVGARVSFSASGTGTSPFYLLWQFNGMDLANGTNVSGATNSATLTISNVQTTNSGFYSLIVTNYGGAVTSSYASLTVTNVPPAISVQPTSQTNGVGATVTLAVFATGTAPLSYQWQFGGTSLTNGGNISGVTTNSLTISNVQTNSGGSYSVVVTNIAGSVTSSNAILTVQTAPIIVAQPATNQSMAVGSTAVFAVTAIGAVTLKYQWWDGTNLLKNGSVNNGPTISGATTNVLFISNVQTTNSSSNYLVIVSNVFGSVTSSLASLTVTNIPPAITVQPVSQTNGVGSTVNFSVFGIGSLPIHFQWQQDGMNLTNGGNISGANTNILKISNVQLTNGGTYTLVITNFGGSATSSNAILTVYSVPVITMQPATNQSMAVGSTATFAITAIGTVPLKYQWWNGTNLLKNGGVINGPTNSGATTNVFTISNVQTTNSSTNYLVIVTNLSGSVTSSLAALLVTNVPPAITVQPAGQTNAVGITFTLTVTVNATATAPVRYRWLNGTNWLNGATNHILSVTNAQTTNSGGYTVIATNFGGSVTSSIAALLVTNVPPTITLQPTNQSPSLGTTVTLAVTATGTAPLSYQWQLNGTNLANGVSISGATTNVLKITNAQTNSSGDYTVVVTNFGGSVTSSIATLTVLSIPVILVQPATNQSMAVGSTATFAVTASGAVPLHYQWWNGTNLLKNGTFNNGPTFSGATTNVLIISNVQTTNSSPNYLVIVTNLSGSVTSSVAALLVTNIPPAITLQPISQTNGVGSTATFTVTATGTAPLSYRWQFTGTSLTNGGHFSGVTTNVLTISTVQLTNGGDYSVIIANNGGSVTSSVATLTVQAVPIIVTQPTNQSMAVGSTMTFTVTAIGTVPLSYQWWNGTNPVKNIVVNNGPTISGATTNQLYISNTQTTNSGNYSVVVTNLSGSVTSSVAALLVTNIPPAITLQPTNQAWPTGSNVTFVVLATGTAPLGYNWQLNGTNLINGGSISGATTNVLTINNAQTNNSGNYTVVITNYGGSATSSVVSLTVASAPVILVQPTSQGIAVGSNTTFFVTAVGVLPLGYQWQVNGTNLLNGVYNGGFLTGATTNALTFGNPQLASSSSNYTVIVTNSAGSVTSSVTSLTVTNIPVAITVQPTNQTVGAGSTVTLAVTATGTAPLSYQWQVDETNLLVNGGQINGATNATLIISNVQTTNNGNYTVTVINPGGSATSSNAVLTVTNIPPTITVQPTNQTVGAGSTVTLVVDATGTPPLSYQWEVDETNILVDGGQFNGAISNVLTISNVQQANGGSYSVTITNIAGQVTSSNAVLMVTNAPPTITVQPTNLTVGAGSTVTLLVNAIGTEPLSYQWQVNETNLLADGGQFNGATSNVLTISNVQLASGGSYSVTITNIAGQVTSSNAVLMVTNAPPTITVQPTNQMVGAGTTVTLVVNAFGTEPLSYQWQVDETNLLVDGGQFNGAISNVLTISNVQLTNGGSYSVTITNLAGTVTSSNAVLTVASSPLILLQPTNQTVGAGSIATFAVTAIGILPLSYQWQVDGTNLVDGGQVIGATTNRLTIGNAQTTNNGTYTVIVMNTAGSATSSNAVLTVTNIPPAIIVQPTNQTVGVGSTVTLAVTATGTAPLSYQWQVDGTNILVDGGQFNGAISNVLIISNMQLANGGNYTVTVTNFAGSVTSSNAVLTVIGSPPSFGQIIAAGGNDFILSGTGGGSNGTYYVLTSSNLLVPLTNWTSISTDQFDSAGNFIFTNTTQTNVPQLFYILQLP